MSVTPMHQTHVRLPADQFYWAVIDASSLPRSFAGHSSNQLGFIFESQLPISVDELHAVYVHMPGTRNTYVACGMSRESLLLHRDALSLSPASLPAFIEGSDAIEPLRNGNAFNQLTGEFTPVPIRTLHRRWLLHLAAITMAVAGLFIAGIERRRHTIFDAADSVRLTRASLIERLVGDSGVSSNQPPELLMTAELRSLQQTRSPAVHGPDTTASAAQSLGSLLAAWPSGIHALAQSLVITRESISIRVDVPSSIDAESFISAMQSLPGGWSLSQTSVNAGQDGVTIQANFTRKKQAG